MADSSKITPKIAEICGVITGDGHLSRYISPKRTDYRVEVFGDKTEEVDYFQYLFLLFQKNMHQESTKPLRNYILNIKAS